MVQETGVQFQVESYQRLKKWYLMSPWLTLSIIIFTQPLRSVRIWHKVNSFKVECNRFEFRVFLLLDLLPHQGWRTQSALPFTHSWRENNWIHTFPKGISAMWNAISPGFELVSLCPIPATITITPRAPQHYKVRIKGKAEQTREWSSTPYTSV